jgi:hypothetical protein
MLPQMRYFEENRGQEKENPRFFSSSMSLASSFK